MLVAFSSASGASSAGGASGPDNVGGSTGGVSM